MMPPDKTNRMQLILATLISGVTVLGMQGADRAFGNESVNGAFRLHIEQGDLQDLATGIGQELSSAPVGGVIFGPVSDELDFSNIETSDIEFSFDVLSANAEFNGSTGIASSILTQHLTIKVDHIKFNSSGTIFCRNLKLRSGNQEMPIHINVTPLVADRMISLSPDRVSFEVDTDLFTSDGTEYCQTPWTSGTIVQKLAPWLVETLQQKIAVELTNKMTSIIHEKLEQENQPLRSQIVLPYKVSPTVAASTVFQVWPNDLKISENTIDVELGSDAVSTDIAHVRSIQNGPLKVGNPTDNSSWMGISDDFLKSTLAAANNYELLKTTFNKNTAAAMSSALNTRAISQVTPDAGTRFRGHEDLAVSLGKASSVSVVYNPNGPGGIPIIDMVLYKVPVQVSAADAPYFNAVSTVRFKFKPEINAFSQMLQFNFIQVDYSFSNFSFAGNLCPRPANLRFDSVAFAAYLNKFIANPQSSNLSGSGLSLPNVSLGDYFFDWHSAGVQLVDQYLVVKTDVSNN